MSSPHRALMVLLATVIMLSVGESIALGEQGKSSALTPPAAAPAPSNEELMRNVQCMEQRIRTLEAHLKAQTAAPAPAGETPQPFNMRFPEPLPTRAVRGSNGTPMPPPIPMKGAAQPAADAVTPSTSPPEPAAKPTEPTAKPSEPVAKPAEQPPKSAAPPAKVATPPNKAADPCAPVPLTQTPVAGLSLGAYGEFKYGSLQNPAANGQWQNGADAHRLVLLPTYAITPNIIFNARSSSSTPAPVSMRTTSCMAQRRSSRYSAISRSWTSSTGAPRASTLSPSATSTSITSRPSSTASTGRRSITGSSPRPGRRPQPACLETITDGVNYQMQVSSSLEDFGDDFVLRTDANTVPPFPIPYAAGIDGLSGLRSSLPVRGDFRQLSNDLAYAGKLDFTPPFVPGLGWSMSVYYTPSTTPRLAHDDFGNLLGRSSLTMFDAELRYRIPKTWLEFRGEYVRSITGSPINLRANNDSDPTNNAGRYMYGYYGEVAMHIPLGTILNRSRTLAEVSTWVISHWSTEESTTAWLAL